MSNTTFAMHDMGWFAFQQLCHTVLREILGQSVQSFLHNNDGGRDGAFHGVWTSIAGVEVTGPCVVQCKHTSISGANLVLSDLTGEFDKAEALVAAGDCDLYVLMTNLGVSGATETKVREAFEARGVKRVLVYGSTWMNQTIIENARLRRLVPRLYGLGDLTQILDDRSYKQAQAVLDSMRTNLDKLVLTSTYSRATTALDEHGFVLLFGAAATGKTTVAAQLALGAADEFDTAVVKLDSAADFQNRWNPDEHQLFWLDDAFGTTQFESDRARAWTAALPRIHSAIHRGSKVVLTSRDYIFRAARSSLKPGSFPLFEEARVAVDVHDLTDLERHQILYNHLRHGTQSNEWLGRLGPNLEVAAAHPGFTPELARRLSLPSFTEKVRPQDVASIERFFAEPDAFLRDVIDGLDVDGRAALGLIFVGHGWLASPVTLDERSKDLVARIGSTLGGVIRALEAMDGSQVNSIVRDGEPGWVFAHPTMADAYSSLMRSPDLVEHLLAGFPLQTLVREVTCGDVGLQGALVLAPAQYDAVLARLDEPVPRGSYGEAWRERDRRTTFLAKRCDAAFLARWVETHPTKFASLETPGVMLQAVAENELAARLNEFGLFPEPMRQEFVGELVAYCLSGKDPAVLWDDSLKSMLTEAEWTALLLRVRDELLTNPGRAIRNCVEEWNQSDDDPASIVEPLSTLALYLPDLFPEDAWVQGQAVRLDGMLDEWISEHQTDDDEDVDDGFQSGPTSLSTWTPTSTRSVFDDLLDGRSG